MFHSSKHHPSYYLDHFHRAAQPSSSQAMAEHVSRAEKVGVAPWISERQVPGRHGRE